ncbi:MULTISPECIES: FMN-binding protein [unclassified Streptomyces]|uniref:FMN-binding protein n=1 Tax=unclassified Streptomyces TaxID=2593676 RepID=UPI001909961C|nr:MULTISPECIES: FMN-binding protein [unclassified Streptomyces]MBK3567850.1 FMN-binding protein [Streptomyces sp. MBT62]MBK6016849.1 FMN-binding protein [Streptomyces sp. MBT53]
MHPLKQNRPLRRIVLASAVTASGLVMLLALKPHTAPEVASAPQVVSSPAPSGSAGGKAVAGTKTVTGETAQTRWGPVQVKITVTSGKITDVTAVQSPSDNPRDQEINSYALPQLKSEALAAQSAKIDTVSGATYTSDGYRQSLQSALDSAGL